MQLALHTQAACVGCLWIALSMSASTAAAEDAREVWEKCSALQGIMIPAQEIALPIRSASVTAARMVPASKSNPHGEYCWIAGEIVPATSKAVTIKFNVAMPSHWNGKTAHLGGLEPLGAVVSPLGVGQGQAGIVAFPPPIARGYVTFGSNSGHPIHDGLGAVFKLNDEQLQDYAGDHLKKTRDVVMYLVRTRYGANPTHNYFLSGGYAGREALIAVQRYPQDYDGVIASSPALAVTATVLKMQTIIRDLWLNDAAGWISKAKANVLRRAELEACDILDGLADGVIGNVAGCHFDLGKLRCVNGWGQGPECFSDAQIDTVRRIQSPTPLPYTLSPNVTSLPGFPVGVHWGEGHYINNWLDNPPASVGDRSNTVFFQVTDAFLRYVLLRDRTVSDTLKFDPLKPGKALVRLQQVSTLINATSTDIDPFIARGGKWILLHGQSEGIWSSNATIDYYRKLVTQYGQAQIDRVVRFYLVPGWGHDDNARAPLLDALENWVERDLAPETLTVVDETRASGLRSRPLCVYPGWPKYNGSGDANLASSFSCARD